MIQKAKPYLRRFFALFLAACLMVGYVPTDALAASPDTATETIAETVTDETSADDNPLWIKTLTPSRTQTGSSS